MTVRELITELTKFHPDMLVQAEDWDRDYGESYHDPSAEIVTLRYVTKPYEQYVAKWDRYHEGPEVEVVVVR